MERTATEREAGTGKRLSMESERRCKAADLEVVEKKMTKYQIDREKYGVPWFTNWFRQALGETRMTVDQVAEATGITPSTVMGYITGVRNPTLRNFLLILEALGKTIEIK